AFQALLQRYSRQADVLVGVEVDRRPDPGAVGAWADLALVRSGPNPPATFRSMVRAAGARLRRAAAGPAAPLTEVAAALGLRRGVDLPTPCRVAFAHRPPPALGAGPAWRPEPLDPLATEFDVELVVSGDEATLVHDADLLAGPRVASMAEGYLRVLASGLAQPDGRRSRLDVVGAADLERLLGAWNDFPDMAPTAVPVHRLVERHAAERPEALALSRGGERLTYGELNRRANQLGRLLRERVDGDEPVVAICMDRSSEWLVAVLAAFKAGAVPVLLDPRAPRRRHELAVEGCRPRLALSLDRLGLDLPVDPGRVVLVDRDWPEIDRRDGADLGLPVRLDDLAYLVQTSGSTGVPKSVGVPHRALAHCGAQQAAAYPIAADDRSTWFAPPGASISIIEIWPYLCAGASLHIAEPEVVASPPLLRDWLVEAGITQTFVIAPVAEILNDLPWPDACALRLMTVAGEKVRRWARADLPFEVAVTYGSAEASYIASCLHPWERRVTSATASAEDRETPPPIGRPWPGVRAYVVDGDLELVPPGAVGELAVDSPELARGYLGDPVKTALKFVPNPYRGAAGSR
ncbi:MAG TPA: AMP-binding protein, partial [Candidatus Dormibacteraeota bacterium]